MYCDNLIHLCYHLDSSSSTHRSASDISLDLHHHQPSYQRSVTVILFIAMIIISTITIVLNINARSRSYEVAFDKRIETSQPVHQSQYASAFACYSIHRPRLVCFKARRAACENCVPKMCSVCMALSWLFHHSAMPRLLVCCTHC